MKKLFLLIISLCFLAIFITYTESLYANPGGVSTDKNGRLPNCLSCHQQVEKQETENTFKTLFSERNLKGGDELKIKVLSDAGDNNVRGIFLTLSDHNRIINTEQQISVSELENPADKGFVFSNNPFENYKEQYHMYKNKAVVYSVKVPNPKKDTDYNFYTVLAYGEDYNNESVYNESNAKYIISEGIKINVSRNPELPPFDENSLIQNNVEEILTNEGIEKIKLSFYDVDRIIGIININIVAFILLTTAILLFISEKYYKRTIRIFYKDREIDNVKSTGVFVFYDLLRRFLLYVSIILISITIIQKRIWVVSLDNYIDIFSFPMLIGLILLIVAVVISFIKLIDDKLRTVLFYVLIGLGYVIYEMGFLLGVNLM